MQDPKTEVFLKHYESLQKWTLKHIGIPKEEALCVVHSFFLRWSKAKVEDRGTPLDALLWVSFKNSAKNYIIAHKVNMTFEEVTELNGGTSLSPADYVLPRISFEQFYASLCESQQIRVAALITLQDNTLVDQVLGLSSTKQIKSRDLAPKFRKYFVGRGDI